jgi:hypothetical protein
MPMRLPTDLGLRRATKDSSSGLLRDHVLQIQPTRLLRIYCCKLLYTLALLSCMRPTGPGDYSVTTALAIFFSNKVRLFINYFTVFLPQRDYWRVRLLATTPRWDSTLKDRDNEYSFMEVFLHSYLNNFITIVFVQLLLRANYYMTTGD